MRRIFAIALTLILLVQGLLIPQSLVAAPADTPVVSNDRPSQAALYFKAIAPVTISATDLTVDLPLVATTSWSANGGPLQNGLPEDLSLTPGACTPSGAQTTCTWQLSGTMMVPPGVYNVRVTVTDPDGGSASTDITIVVVVIDPNYPPTAEAGGPYTLAEGTQITLTGSGTDPDGDTLAYYWDLDNNGSFETAGQNVAFFGDDGPAERVVVLHVCDDRGECDEDAATITITNVPPLVSNNLPEQTTRRYHPVQVVTISAADVPGDLPLAVSTEWTKDGGAANSGLPAGVTLTANACTPVSPLTTCTWLLGGTAEMERGEYLIALRFDDHDGGISSTTIKIIVPNEPPTANAGGPYSVNEGEQVALQGAGTDPEGFPLTYAWDLDNNGTFETAGQNPMFSALSLDGPATRTVVLQVCDDWDACVTATATITIANVAPVVTNDRPSQSVQIPNPIAAVKVTYADVTPDTPLAVATSWTLNGGASQAGLPAGLTFAAPVCAPDGPKTTCTMTTQAGSKLAVGTYVVKVTVSDDDGGVASTEFTITVERAKYFLPLVSG